MNKRIFFYSSLVLISCGSENELEEKVETVGEVENDTITEIVQEVQLIDMYPEVKYESLQDFSYDEKSNLRFYKGMIGNNPIEISYYLNSSLDGRYVYVDKPTVNFSISGDVLAEGDSISFVRSEESETKEYFFAKSTNKRHYEGIWVKELDTLTLKLDLQESNPTQSQFFIDNQKVLQLHLTQDDIYGSNEYGNVFFNSFQSFSRIGEGFDTGQSWEFSYAAVFFRDSTIILLEAEVSNSFSDNYVENHGYESEDPITDGVDYHCSVEITISVIEKGIATKKEISFNSNKDNLQLYIFNDYLIFIGSETDVNIIYKWDDNSMNYVPLK